MRSKSSKETATKSKTKKLTINHLKGFKDLKAGSTTEEALNKKIKISISETG